MTSLIIVLVVMGLVIVKNTLRQEQERVVVPVVVRVWEK